MSNVSKPNKSNLHNQWRFINAGKIGGIGSDSNVPLAWKFVTGREVMPKSMDNEALMTHCICKESYQTDVSFNFKNLDGNCADRFPKPDADCEDGFGIIESLYLAISEHLEMLQQGMSVEDALQPLLNDVSQVLDFGVLCRNLTDLLAAMSKTLDVSLAPDQVITILESFQDQLQEIPFQQVFDFHKTAISEVAIANSHDVIEIIGEASLAFLADIKWSRDSGLDIEEKRPKFNELHVQEEGKTQPSMSQVAHVHTFTVGTR